MNLDPQSLPLRDRYAFMIAAIVPRPIAWVSTVDRKGAANLAPFSYFTGITAEPMSVCFAPANSRTGEPKDTLANVRSTRQFVVNIATEDNVAQMNQTSAAYPRGVSEIEKAGLTPLPSVKVRPPRVKESPLHLECELMRVVTVSRGPLGGNLVIGRVVWMHVEDALWNGGRMRHQDLKAVGRMEGSWYARTRDAFELPRAEAS